MSIKFDPCIKIMGALFLALLYSHLSSAQITFERTYGGPFNDVGLSVQQTSDGGYILVGMTKSFGAGESDVYLIKTDFLGDTLWTRTYGGAAQDWGLSVQQTSDAGYIISGFTESFGAGRNDVYLIKTDSLGDTLWTRSYGGGNNDVGWSVQQTSDGGYIVTGGTWSFGAGRHDGYLVKTDSLGNILWTKTFGGFEFDHGTSVKQTSDGGYIIAGHTSSFGAGLDDVYLVKMDFLGSILWTKTYGDTLSDFGYSVQQTSDGGFIIAGVTSSFGADGPNVYFIKTDASGDTLWTRTYGSTGFDVGYFVQQTQDEGYIIVGLTFSFGADSGDVYLIRTDSLGDTLWTKTFGGIGFEEGRSVQQTRDEGFIIAGRSSSFGAGGRNVYLIKTCPDGSVGPCKKNCLTFDDLDQTIAEAEIDNEGVRNSLQAKANSARRQFNRGNLKASGNVLCALLHEVDAQEGRHIDPASAQDIRNCVTTLAGNLGIPLPCESNTFVNAPLFPNFPNPFHSKTTIGYHVHGSQDTPFLTGGNTQHVSLRIYDLVGREVRTLVEGKPEEGYHTVEWDGQDNGGRRVPSGIYFYRLQSGDFTNTRKLILLR